MILVTGSSGRIGRQVVAALLGQGRPVRGFDLRPSVRQHPDWEEVTGSPEDPAAVSRALEGATHVLHLGAFMSWAAEDRDAMFRANVEGTRLLLDTAAASGIRRFVFASSGEVYPETSPESLPVTEDHPLRPTG